MKLSSVLTKKSFLKLVHLAVWLNVLYLEYLNFDFFYGRSVHWIQIKYGYTLPLILNWSVLIERYPIGFFMVTFTCIFLAMRYFYSFSNKVLRGIVMLYIIEGFIVYGILLILVLIFSEPWGNKFAG